MFFEAELLCTLSGLALQFYKDSKQRWVSFISLVFPFFNILKVSKRGRLQTPDRDDTLSLQTFKYK